MYRSQLPLRLAFLAEIEDFRDVVEVGGQNRGPAVAFFLKLAGRDPNDAEAWCAALLNAAAEIACAKKNVPSPLERFPLQAYVQAYYDHGRHHGWITDEPRIGDLFVLWHRGKRRYAHAGAVTHVHPPPRFRTIEGNSNDDGGREGWKVAERVRERSPGIKFLNPWGD